MKHFLIPLLVLFSFLVQAQIKPPAPTLTYRQGNTNELDMIISSAGTLLTPGNSLSITAEIRLSDVGRIVATVPMASVDTTDGTIRGILPNLDPSLYYLGLYVKYASGEPEFRVGLGYIEIVPKGSLKVVTDASGLNIQISTVRQVLNVKLDATPSAAIAAFYAQQARNSLSTKLNVTDSTLFVRKRAGLDLSQNSYTNSEKAKVAATIPYAKVATFAAAKLAITAGVPKAFTIMANERFGNATTNSYYDGTNWYHSPALLQNN